MHFSRPLNCWSLRCSWSIAYWPCSNYIFILNLIPGFNVLGKDSYKMTREAFKFWDLVRLILETLRYVYIMLPKIISAWQGSLCFFHLEICRCFCGISAGMPAKFQSDLKNKQQIGASEILWDLIDGLTRCGLVMPNGNIDLGQHWFR